MNYDQWKLDNPFDNEDDSRACKYCKQAIKQDTNYCSYKCEENDN